ncbi:MAG: TIGR03016 family PEP-CTERM system-associated outer membrane protein, partial [Gammaproteobacteria bacterium]
DSTTDLVSRSLFLDARASYSQQFITPEGTIDLDNLSDIQNRADVLTYSLSPYLRQQYGSTANAEYRVSSQRVEYKETTSVEELNSTTNNASIMLESGTAFNQLLWRITYSYNKINYDEQGADSTLQRELLALRYRLTPKFAALGNIGYENNDYAQVVGEDPPSGSIWSAGFAWTPSRRTSLEVTAGERYFGSTGSLNFTHRTRRTQWSLQYTEEITSTPELQAELTGEVGPTGNPLFNVTQTTSVILLERWQFSFSFDTGKTIITTDLYDNQVEFQTTKEQESTLGATLTWRWRFMPRTSAVLNTTWYETEPRGSNRTDTLTDAGVSIERQLSRSVTGSLGYGKLTRNSDVPTAEYERNLISLVIRAQF